MRKLTTAVLLCAGAALILDSACAAESAREALKLCAGTLIPSLFPLLVISAMLVPGLQNLRLSGLSRLLRMPEGSGGVWLLGVCGGFPVGAACIAQASQSGTLPKPDARRMLGLCSLCGPAFLFGVLPRFLPMKQVSALFLIQLETSLLLCALWPGTSRGSLEPSAETVSMPQAVRRAIESMLSVCAWVLLAAVAAGFLRRWLFSLLPDTTGVLLTGLLELTNGIFCLPEQDRFLLCTLFVCFGGVSVLLQISSLAAPAGLSMGTCIAQKALHGILGLGCAIGYEHLGPVSLLMIPAFLLGKIIVEIPDTVVYNGRERKGSKCCFAKKWSNPVSTAGSARR